MLHNNENSFKEKLQTQLNISCSSNKTDKQDIHVGEL